MVNINPSQQYFCVLNLFQFLFSFFFYYFFLLILPITTFIIRVYLNSSIQVSVYLSMNTSIFRIISRNTYYHILFLLLVYSNQYLSNIGKSFLSCIYSFYLIIVYPLAVLSSSSFLEFLILYLYVWCYIQSFSNITCIIQLLFLSSFILCQFFIPELLFESKFRIITVILSSGLAYELT